jgi:hypothetical protein
MRHKQSLGSNRGRGPILRPLKAGEELIGPAIHLVATRIRHRLAEQAPMLVPNGTVVLPEPMDERCRPFDVREEHRHGPGRQLGHTNRQSLEPLVT